MTPGQVLIVSDDSEFVRSLVVRWRAERDSPAITVVSTEVSRQAAPSEYELVVVGPYRDCVEIPQAPALHPDSVVCVVGDLESLKLARCKNGNWLLLPEFPGWPRVLLFITREVLRRAAAESRAREAETSSLSQRRFTILGKSVQDARPGMVNALTSLLGNADLMLLSEESLPAEAREQVQTIHTMALRLNEMVQRLSSLENEMELSEKKSHLETPENRMLEARRE